MRRSKISTKRKPGQQQQNKQFIKVQSCQNKAYSPSHQNRTPRALSKCCFKQQSSKKKNKYNLDRQDCQKHRHVGRSNQNMVSQFVGNSFSERNYLQKQQFPIDRQSLRNIANQELSQQAKANPSVIKQKRPSFSMLQANLGKLNSQYTSQSNNAKYQKGQKWVDIFLQKLEQIIPSKKMNQRKQFQSMHQQRIQQSDSNLAQNQRKTKTFDLLATSNLIKIQLGKMIKQTLLPFVIEKISQLEEKIIVFASQINQKITTINQNIKKQQQNCQKINKTGKQKYHKSSEKKVKQYNNDLQSQTNQIKEQLKRLQFSKRKNSSSGKIRKNVFAVNWQQEKQGSSANLQKQIFQLRKQVKKLNQQNLEKVNDLQLSSFQITKKMKKMQEHFDSKVLTIQKIVRQFFQNQKVLQPCSERIQKQLDKNSNIIEAKQVSYKEVNSQKNYFSKFEKVIRVYNQNFVEVESRLTKVQVHLSKLRNGFIKQDRKIRKSKS